MKNRMIPWPANTIPVAISDIFDFDEKTWGATLGGAVLKDQLFFFASYETTARHNLLVGDLLVQVV
ncbi:hypothetical protein [Alishewanella longhuensis]